MFLGALAIGLGATLVMDAWNLLLKHALGLRSLDYCLLGRWIGHMPSGTFRHVSIAAAEAKPGECVLGWTTHYSIGAAFAAVFVALASPAWLEHPTPLPAIVYGLVTVVSPFFVLQPSLGLGVASSLAPNAVRARAKSLVTHLVFGVGLWVAGLTWATLTNSLVAT